MRVPINKHIASGLAVLLFALIACSLPETATPNPSVLAITAAPSQATTPSEPSAQLSSPTIAPNRATPLPQAPEHRISTHRIYGIAGFYDRLTTKSFTPRGTNYDVLVPILDHYEDRTLAEGVFSVERTRADFKSISAAGYNTVRIIIDDCVSGDECIGVKDGQGLNPAYLDNMVSLMKLAKEANLFLIFASDDIPELGGYAARANQEANQVFEPGRNAGYLTKSGIQAAQEYWADLMTELIGREAPFEVILGWEIQAEQYYQLDQAPFSLETGKVKPANEHSYDLSKTGEKEALAEDGLRYYIQQVRKTILSYDPTALVTLGFSAPSSPDAWDTTDNQLVLSAAMLEDSDLDFFDLHANPGQGLTIAEISENFGLKEHLVRPVLMGEVGANTWKYPEIDPGVIAVQDWIAASCGFGFSGWLYNGYYPSPAGLFNATWGLVDEHNKILKALSPQLQPDACTTNVLPGRNLALGKPVTVSGALPDQTPEMAVDGDQTTQWSSGGFPEQWIEVDLGAAYTIGEIRLTVGQWPDGEVLHQVWVGAGQDTLRQVFEVSGEEYDYDVLSLVPEVPLKDIRYLRIVTTESPAWVSWREIEVLAPYPSTPIPPTEAALTPTP